MLAGAEPSGAEGIWERPPDPGVGLGRKKCWLHAHTGHYTLLEIRCAARERARLQALLVPAAVLRSCGLRREGVRAPLTC